MSWFNRHYSESDVKMAEDLSSAASGSIFSRIAGGVIAPLAVGGYGAYACIVQKATFLGRQGTSLELTGTAAISFGIALLGLALFLHFHFIWTVSQRLFGVADFCKATSMLIFLGGFGYVLWRIVMFGV